jgi:hypothetical protein
MNSTNWRYSDCQFSISACPKLEDVTYRPRDSVSGCWSINRACAISSLLYSCQPAIACATSAPRNNARKNSDRPLSRSQRRMAQWCVRPITLAQTSPTTISTA